MLPNGRTQGANERVDMKRVTDNYEYDPDDVLGSGTASTVYRGRALDTGETVAVKVVRAEMEKDLEKEVGFLMALSHPNIVHILAYKSVCDFELFFVLLPLESHHWFSFHKQPCIVLEFCDEGDLGHILAAADRPFSEERTRFWMQQLGLLCVFFCFFVQTRGFTHLHKHIHSGRTCISS